VYRDVVECAVEGDALMLEEALRDYRKVTTRGRIIRIMKNTNTSVKNSN
jgi:hypothetical protein